PADDITKPFTEHFVGIRLIRPKCIEETVPPLRLWRIRVVRERHAHLTEVERRMWVQLTRRYVEQTVAGGHNRPALATVEPAGLFEVIRKNDTCAQRFEQIADLVSVGQPRCRIALAVEVERVLGERVQHRAHRPWLRFGPMRRSPGPPASAPKAQR